MLKEMKKSWIEEEGAFSKNWKPAVICFFGFVFHLQKRLMQWNFFGQQLRLRDAKSYWQGSWFSLIIYTIILYLVGKIFLSCNKSIVTRIENKIVSKYFEFGI